MNIRESAQKFIQPTTKLYPYQVEGVAFMQKHDGRILLGDEMGVGKTLQALTWCALNPIHRPVLIVCPSRLKYNWANEIDKFLQNVSYQIVGTRKDILQYDVDFTICSYDILSDSDSLKPHHKIKLSDVGSQIVDCEFQVMIVDEAHNLASNTTKRTKAVKAISKDIPHLMFLTGTPLRNRPANFFNILNMLNKDDFPSWWQYVHRYCAAKQGRFGLDVSGFSNLKELSQKIQPIMLRRTKQQVMKDLPDKTRTFLPVELDYNPQLDPLLNSQNIVKRIGLEKVDSALDFMRNFVEESESGAKLVVFAHHHDVLDAIYYRTVTSKNMVALQADGRLPSDKYNQTIELFKKNSGMNILLLGIQGAQGFNLTEASNALFVEMLYVPADLQQAEDRLHRHGTKSAVNIYYLVARNTIDEYIMQVLNGKTEVIQQVLSGDKYEDPDIVRYLKKVLKGHPNILCP